MSEVYSIAFWTHIAQGLAFPLLVIVTTWWFVRAIQEPGVQRKEKIRERLEALKEAGPMLQPLSCKSCGAAMKITGLEMRCEHCKVTASAPEDYRCVMSYRAKIQADMHNASVYLVRARRLSSNWVRLALVLALALLCASPVVLAIGSTQFDRYDPIAKRLGGFFGAMFVTDLLWILCLFFTLLVFGRVKRQLPAFSLKSVAHNDTTPCQSCGGHLQFQAHDLAGICPFCGVITYRAGIAWKERKGAREQAQAAEGELIEAEYLAKEKFDDLVGTPAIILYLLVVCPVVLFGLPSFFKWAWEEHRSILISSAIGLIVLLGVVARLSPKDKEGKQIEEFSDSEPEKLPE